MTKTALPLVLLPGLLCDEQAWAAQAAVLGQSRSVAVGPLGLPDGLDRLDSMARYLLDVLPEARFALAGHSMGGRIALEMLRLAPHRVSGLALLDTGVSPRPADERGDEEQAARLALVELASTQGMEAVARRWLPPMVHAVAPGSAGFEAMVAMVKRSNPRRFAAQEQALLRRPDAEPVLRAARCPVLLLCGEQDRWSPPEDHRAMQAMVPRSVLRVVPDCGHMSLMEQPAAVTAALAAWLEICDAA